MDRLPANPTIVFIPGAFHTAAHFGPLSLYLNKKGYDNFALRLPSVSERAGKEEGGLAHDVASIKALLEVLVKDENSVVLVMHDTGAIAGTQAAVNLTRTRRLKEGKKKGGIISMVFIDGILSREGESLESMMRNLGEPALPQYAVVDGPILRPTDKAAAILYGHLPPDQAVRWSTNLDPQSLSVFREVLRGTHWDVDVPVTFVRCVKSPGVERTLEMVDAVNRANWTVETIESEGAPLISQVEELGCLIVQAAQVE